MISSFDAGVKEAVNVDDVFEETPLILHGYSLLISFSLLQHGDNALLLTLIQTKEPFKMCLQGQVQIS